MTITQADIDAGQKIYTKQTLRLYDWLVLGISNRFIWQCPTKKLVAHYNKHLSANHLDIGVGTGYFLDHATFPNEQPRLALMDINKDCLATAQKRVARYQPEVYEQNILEPITQAIKPFDSIGLNYVFHCLPGNLDYKQRVFEYLKTVMNPGAVVFGSTVLQGHKKPNVVTRRLLKAYNQAGIFSNEEDTLEVLEKILADHFSEYGIEVIGQVALFWGKAH